MSIADDLERLRQLHAAGDLTDDEYAQAKAAALGQSPSGSPAAGNAESYFEPDSRQASQDDWQAPGGAYFENDPEPRQAPHRNRSQSRARNSMAEWLSENEWAMMLHLSQFAGYVAPGLGFVLPILIWQILKDELPSLDRHGRIVMNWLLSGILYAVVCFVLFFIAIGLPLLIILTVLAIVFPIIGALKANGGEAWEYPLSIRFFALRERPADEEW